MHWVSKHAICGLVYSCFLAPLPEIHTVHMFTASGPSQARFPQLPRNDNNLLYSKLYGL